MKPSLEEAIARHGRLGYGAAQLGNLYRTVDDATAREALETAWDLGIRHFDTAPHYGLGLSERRLGAFLQTKPRDEFILSTKVGRLLRDNPHPQGKDTEGFEVPDDLYRVRDYSSDGVKRSLEESLERLGLDRVDIAYIHDPDEYWEQALHGAVPALSELREQGVIQAWGAGMNQWQMLERFVGETQPDIIMLAGRYTLLEQEAAQSLLPACVEHNVKVNAVGVFNSGLLARQDVPDDAHYNYDAAPPELLARARKLADLAAEYSTTLPAAALAFPMRHSAIVTSVVGMRTPDHVRRNVELFETPVPDEFWSAAADAGLITNH
ncbi:aldo/keto reductase [Kocuria atrinae]|uniref:Aldo/keto reductase n=1 Tax=Kocuria atrinae TaxID=592377 RepID=A0ABN2XFQ4_9MICC